MPFYSDYKCTLCGEACDPEHLVRKKVDFVTLGGTGRKSRVVRSRTQDWLCPRCRDKDPAWNIESHNTPGMQSPARNRVRAAQAKENNDGGSAGDRAQATEVPADSTGAAGSHDAGYLSVASHDDRAA